MMIGVREIFWGPLMAGTTVVTLPVVIVFIYVQKHIISGLTMGAVKG
jgi:N,N'-diacetylchitobiose transport system permease protein